ncbi:retrovirus-related pol polyprotein from transposon TNT 1-94 [Tanacetum coccineum]
MEACPTLVSQESLSGRDCGLGIGVGKLTSTSLEELQWFNFFLHMGLTDILATLKGLSKGNSQVKDNKIDLLVQQYEQFVIFKDEYIDSAFARFNTIITSLKALDEGYSSKNYVRKFLRDLHPKLTAKVTAIEESKDLTSLSLDELIGSLKVHEMIIKKDSEIVKEKVERKYLALKAKKESGDEKCSTSRTEDEEYAMVVRNFKKFFKRIEYPKPPKDKNQRAFVRGFWSDSGKEDDEKVNDETCLVAQASSEVCSESSYFSDENSSIDDLVLDNEYDKLCKISLKIITKNKRLKATRNNLEKECSVLKEKVSILEKNKGVDLECVKYHMLKIENEKLKEEVTRLNKVEKTSSSGNKEIKFVKAQKKASLDGGPINMGGPQSVQAAPKTIMGPPPVGTPGSEKIDLEPDKWITDSGCSKHMMGNRKLFSRYKAYNGGNVIFGGNLRGNIIGKGQICDNKCRVTFFEHDSEITKDGKVIGRGYSQNSKAYIILNKHTRKIKESLNVTFDETPPPSKTSPLVDDDLDEEEAIKVTEKKNLENDIEDETLEIDEMVNIKESRNHPLENVIGNLNQRTLRSQAQNQSNFFCFISTIEPKNVNEALADESWIVAMQEELNQFIANDVWELVPQPRNMTIIGTKWVFRNKLDENGIVSRNKARLVAQGYNQQEGIDYDETYAPVARLESIRILLAYACALDFKLFQMDVKSAFLNGFINEEVYVAQPPGFIDFEKPDHVYKLKKALYGLKQAPKAWLQIKQMEDGIFFNQSKYIKEMLKKFSLEESKPMKTPMSSDTKLTKDEECESVDSTKYQGIIGTTHLGLWYPKGTGIEIVVYVDSDHAGDYKQTTLAISTTEAEYVSAEKACRQALWMKQALIDYDIRLDDIPIMCDNKGKYSDSEDSSLDSLRINQESSTPYQTHTPTPNEIIQSITTTGQTIFPNKILKEELHHDMRSWNEINQDNAFGTQNNSNFLPASSCHMMY